MKEEKRITKKLKNKSLLWYAGLIFVILGIIGIAYGAFVTYNGILLNSFKSPEIEEALANQGMTTHDGVNALVGFGTIIIIVYLIMLGIGILGMMSSGRILTRRTLFWYAIVIMSILLLLGISNILEWGMALVGILAAFFYAFSVYRKFNHDLKHLSEKKPKDHE